MRRHCSRQFIRGWGRPVRIAAATGCVCLIGCAELPASVWKDLNEARRDYDRREIEAATGRLDRLLEKYPNHRDSAQAYYLRALCHTKRSNKVGAEADARQCLRLSRDKHLTANAHATLATLLFEANRTREALSHFPPAFQEAPGRGKEDLLRYRYGLCLQRENRWKEARLEFAAVYQHHADSPTAQHAKRLFEWPHDFFSIQCGAFRDKSSASELQKKLTRSGLKARVESRTRSGELLSMVYVGKYARYGQARDALRSVQRQVSDAIIMPQ